MTQDAKKYKPKDIGLKVRFSFSFVEIKWNHNEDKCSSNDTDMNSMSVCLH